MPNHTIIKMHYIRFITLCFFVHLTSACEKSSVSSKLSFKADELVVTHVDKNRAEIGFGSKLNPIDELQRWMIENLPEKKFTVITNKAEMSEQTKILNDINEKIGSEHYSFEIIDRSNKDIIVYISSMKISVGETSGEQWMCSVSIFQNPSGSFISRLVNALQINPRANQ